VEFVRFARGYFYRGEGTTDPTLKKGGDIGHFSVAPSCRGDLHWETGSAADWGLGAQEGPSWLTHALFESRPEA